MQQLEVTKTQLLTLLSTNNQDNLTISFDQQGRIWIPEGSLFKVIDKDGSSREVDLI